MGHRTARSACVTCAHAPVSVPGEAPSAPAFEVKSAAALLLARKTVSHSTATCADKRGTQESYRICLFLIGPASCCGGPASSAADAADTRLVRCSEICCNVQDRPLRLPKNWGSITSFSVRKMGAPSSFLTLGTAPRPPLAPAGGVTAAPKRPLCFYVPPDVLAIISPFGGREKRSQIPTVTWFEKKLAAKFSS